jgi:broad specificity phosphatase PhoE
MKPPHTMQKTTLILIRHGETETNVKKVLHEYNDPAPLTSLGKKQIELTAGKLAQLNLQALFSSTKKRAIESAEIISTICKIKLQLKEDIAERNWGELSGKPWGDIKQILNPLSLDERYDYTPLNGESWKEFESRLLCQLDYIVAAHRGSVIGIVTHGGVIRALMPYLLNVPKEESFKYNPNNSSLSIFEFVGDTITVVTIDDTAHLNSASE